MKNNTSKSAKGFTLIELLVVIAIIAILAAILFPVFAQAREKARQTACLSNTKQIGLAMIQYAQDYDESYPMGHWNAGDPVWAWDHYIEPYAQSAGTVGYGNGKQGYLECPSDSVDRNLYFGRRPERRSYGITGSQYVRLDQAWDIITAVPGGEFTPGRTLGDFGSPASTILIVEAPLKGNRIGHLTEFAMRGPGPSTIATSTAPLQARDTPGKNPFHAGGWNYAFADGHSKWFKPEQTVQTAGVTYPKRNKNGVTCGGSVTSPCGMWTLSEDD